MANHRMRISAAVAVSHSLTVLSSLDSNASSIDVSQRRSRAPKSKLMSVTLGSKPSRCAVGQIRWVMTGHATQLASHVYPLKDGPLWEPQSKKTLVSMTCRAHLVPPNFCRG